MAWFGWLADSLADTSGIYHHKWVGQQIQAINQCDVLSVHVCLAMRL